MWDCLVFLLKIETFQNCREYHALTESRQFYHSLKFDILLTNQSEHGLLRVYISCITCIYITSVDYNPPQLMDCSHFFKQIYFYVIWVCAFLIKSYVREAFSVDDSSFSWLGHGVCHSFFDFKGKRVTDLAINSGSHWPNTKSSLR